jgi:hypothetical protein
MSAPAGLAELLEEVVQPSRSDIVEAKRVLLSAVADGSAHSSDVLVRTLAESRGVAMPAERSRLDIPSLEAMPETVTASHPIIENIRLQVAATEAVAELESEGILVGAERDSSKPWSPLVPYNVPWSMQGTSSGVRLELQLPTLEPEYRLPHRLRDREPSLFDPDLFLDGLEALALTAQTRQIAEEALQAYRRGLYIACASLLGALSEGAWYSLGERLRGVSGKLDDALDKDATAAVQKQLADRIREAMKGTAADEILAQATLLRELRNFGVHPRVAPRADLTEYFTEATCGLLIMTTRRYLQKLSDVAGRTVSHHLQNSP